MARKRNTQSEFRTLPSFDQWREEHGSTPPVSPKDIPPAQTPSATDTSPDEITDTAVPPFFAELIAEQPRISPLLRDEIPQETKYPDPSAEGLFVAEWTASSDTPESGVSGGSTESEDVNPAVEESRDEDTAVPDSEPDTPRIRERSARKKPLRITRQEREPKLGQLSAMRMRLTEFYRGMSTRRRRLLVMSTTAFLAVAMTTTLLFGTGYLALIRPTQGISTAFGPAASVPVVVNTSATVKSGDVVLSEVSNVSGSTSFLIGYVRGINANEISLSDGVATRLVPLSSVKGVVIFPTPLTSR